MYVSVRGLAIMCSRAFGVQPALDVYASRCLRPQTAVNLAAVPGSELDVKHMVVAFKRYAPGLR